MLIPLIVRSDVPVFLIVITFSDVPPILSFPRLTYTGLTDILGVCASKGAGDTKAENTRTNILKNITNDFNFISFTPMVYVPTRQGQRRHLPVEWCNPEIFMEYLYQRKELFFKIYSQK